MEDNFYDIMFPPYTGNVQIGELYYDLLHDLKDAEHTAEVVCQSYEETSNYPDLMAANIPPFVTFGGDDYHVISIGMYAFQNCSRLTSVVIPDTVTEIKDYAFGFCKALTQIVIPKSVISIGYSAFEFCEVLASIDLPDSITSIRDHAFDNCDSLSSLTCKAILPPVLEQDVFHHVEIPVYVPAESIERYKTAPQWQDFKDIRPIK